jgi:hypothetical protein
MATFRRGAKGSEVRKIQERLKGLGLVSERAARKVGSAAEARMAAEQRGAGERGRHAKSVFAITQKGVGELTRWVAEGPADWNVLKHLTCLRLFYGHLVEPAKLIERLEANSLAGGMGVMAILER